MPAFEFTALDERGRTTRGVVEGATARNVRQQLRDRGLMPLTVEALAEPAMQPQRRRRGRFGTTELAVFMRQLATLVESGQPIADALLAIARQSDRRYVKTVVLGLRAGVTEGRSVGQAMRDFPGAFPEVIRAAIEAGEQSGHLGEILERLADYAERRQQLVQKVLLALVYPALLVLVAGAIVMALLTYVVPEVTRVFEGVGRELPLLTRSLIALSGFLQSFGPAMAVAVVIALVLSRQALRFGTVRSAWDRLLLRVPMVSYLLRSLDTARFTRTLSVLLGSGVPMLEALNTAVPVVGNLGLRRSFERAAEGVREGTSLSAALGHEGCMPPVIIQLMASGEAGGRLDRMLEKAADNQERELESVVAASMALLEPLLILVMGAVVLLIVLAILAPIFELNQLIK